jgi:hypothetical protein
VAAGMADAAAGMAAAAVLPVAVMLAADTQAPSPTAAAGDNRSELLRLNESDISRSIRSEIGGDRLHSTQYGA